MDGFDCGMFGILICQTAGTRATTTLVGGASGLAEPHCENALHNCDVVVFVVGAIIGLCFEHWNRILLAGRVPSANRQTHNRVYYSQYVEEEDTKQIMINLCDCVQVSGIGIIWIWIGYCGWIGFGNENIKMEWHFKSMCGVKGHSHSLYYRSRFNFMVFPQKMFNCNLLFILYILLPFIIQFIISYLEQQIPFYFFVIAFR